MNNAQSALEYLLVIGGGVLIGALAVIIIFNASNPTSDSTQQEILNTLCAKFSQGQCEQQGNDPDGTGNCQYTDCIWSANKCTGKTEQRTTGCFDGTKTGQPQTCTQDSDCALQTCKTATCTNQTCNYTGITTCTNGDNCCPATCSASNDTDCQTPANCQEGDTQQCSITNEFGECIGTEQCINNFWAECTAKTPSLETCSDNIDNDCDGQINEGCSGTGFFGMNVLSAIQNGNEIQVTTTGALYIIKQGGIELWRRIDPATNNDTEAPRKVAEISFENAVSGLTVESATTQQAIIQSDKARFIFNSDSFFMIEAKQPFAYTFNNLISPAPWNKGSGLDRIWTDGYGGSLHAKMQGNPVVSNETTDSTSISLPVGSSMGNMVFPPKKFDFEKLYGANSRPFVSVIYTADTLEHIMSGEKVNDYIDDGFGVFMIWPSVHYANDPGKIGEDPVLLPSGVMGHKIKEEVKPLLQQFVSFAHSHGFKVITYMSAPSLSWWNQQDVQTTLQWMREFQNENNFDGWYFDNADAGNLEQDYNFIRQVRMDIGDEGIIYHHDSVDAWDPWLAYTGRKAVMLDAYVNYTLTGETGEIAGTDSPADPYFRFFVSGYGMSQAFGSEIRITNGKAAISNKEMYRVLAQNLNSAQWGFSDPWTNYFKPLYDQRKASYQSSSFNPNVEWPINEQSGWFRAPTNVQVIPVTGTSVRVEWETNEQADSEVAYTSNGIWWYTEYEPYPDGPDGVTGNSSLTTSHSIVISNLQPNKNYEFRIRSSNQEAIMNESIWGYIGSFTTGAADGDNDGMADDWELQYFGNLGRNGTGDFDIDSLTDLQEFNEGTDPTRTDTDFDTYSDSSEITSGYDPLNWSSHPPVACNNNAICENGETNVNCSNDCDPDLVARWSFDHGNAWDGSGNQHNGIIYGATWQENAGHNGTGAFLFNGNSFFPDYINLGNQLSDYSLYGGENGKSTIAAWIKLEETNKFNVVTHHLGGIDYLSAGHSALPGKLISMVWNANTETNSWPISNGTISAGTWHHIAFVFQGEIGWKYYIDGVLDSESQDTALTLHNYSEASQKNSAYIGYGGADEPNSFKGLIDDVSLWKKALTPDKICTLAGKTWAAGNCN